MLSICARYRLTVVRWSSTMPRDTNALLKNVNHQDIKAVDKFVKGSYTSIADFYADKSIFITGGTGFIGKVLIEKLLYSCKDIKNIFILIRGKNGSSVEERLQHMITKPVFSRLIEKRPQDLNKIIPIMGDIVRPKLGISQADEKTLIEKVSIVFHVAATVKFNATLDDAVTTNVKGTQHVVNLCHRINNLKAFVHVSTAYCNTDHKILDEKVYPRRAEYDEVFYYMKQPDQDSKYIQQRFLKGLATPYTFAKSLAENYVEENCKDIPTAIVRPAIVSPSFNEPLPGWTDSWFGATGLIVASLKGANKVVFGDRNNTLDIIPVDFVSNATILAAASCSSSNFMKVYNCCTSSCNPVSIDKFYTSVKSGAIKTNFGLGPFEGIYYTRNNFLLNSLTFLLQIVPAYTIDLLRLAKGKQAKYVKLQSRVIKGRQMLDYYTSYSWEMKADNVKSLYVALSSSDKTTYPCDPSDIDWDQYTAVFLNYINYLSRQR